MLGDLIFGTLGAMNTMTNGLLGDVTAVGCAVVAEMIPATPEAATVNSPVSNFVLPSSLSARGAMLARLIDKTVKFESELPRREYSDFDYDQGGSNYRHNKFAGIGRIVNVKYDKSSIHSDAKIMEFVIIEIPAEKKDHCNVQDGLVHRKFLVDITQILSVVNLEEKSNEDGKKL